MRRVILGRFVDVVVVDKLEITSVIFERFAIAELNLIVGRVRRCRVVRSRVVRAVVVRCVVDGRVMLN